MPPQPVASSTKSGAPEPADSGCTVTVGSAAAIDSIVPGTGALGSYGSGSVDVGACVSVGDAETDSVVAVVVSGPGAVVSVTDVALVGSGPATAGHASLATVSTTDANATVTGADGVVVVVEVGSEDRIDSAGSGTHFSFGAGTRSPSCSRRWAAAAPTPTTR